MFSYGDHIRASGPFNLEGIPPDDYTLELRELPEGCYLKLATFAGADILHRLLRLSDTPGGRLSLMLACDGASLTARVTDRDGNPISNVHLYVMPDAVASAAALADVLQTSEIENGWSEAIKPLPPGKYLVLASDIELDGTAEPILKLWRARSQAKEIEIGPREAARITLDSMLSLRPLQ
jgi:hypothetical protein